MRRAKLQSPLAPCPTQPKITQPLPASTMASTTKYTSVPAIARAVPAGPLRAGAAGEAAEESPYRSDVDVPREALGLSWEDTFFETETYASDDVVAVFDFDYALVEDFNAKVGSATLAALCLYPPILALACLGCAPCFLRSNVSWTARAQHVALTRDGIRFVRDRRRTCWGLSCTDAGKVSKTVPYDMITDCDVEEPAGNACLCCIPRVLATVHVDTASSGGPEHRHELKLSGLKDPIGFKRLVWAMKRHNRAGADAGTGTGTGTGSGVAAQAMDRGGMGGEPESVALLLREIRDELRELRQGGKGGAEVGDFSTFISAAVSAPDDSLPRNIV